MFTRLSRFYSSIKLGLDISALCIAFWLAHLTRFHLMTSGAPPAAEDSLVMLAIILILYPIALFQGGLYTTTRSRSHFSEVFQVFRAMIVGTVLTLAASYFKERYSRGALLLFALYAIVGVAGFRVAIRTILSKLRRRGLNIKSVLLVGAAPIAERIHSTILLHRDLGFSVVGLLVRDPATSPAPSGIAVLGSYGDLEDILKRKGVDQVVIALPSEEHALLRPMMDVLALHTVDVKLVPDYFDFVTLRGGLEEFGGLPLIRLQGDPMEGWNRVLKRIFDVFVSTLILLLAAPMLLVLGIAVRLSGPGPILYRQVRMGIDGRLFAILKFRTMRLNAEAQGAQFAHAVDPRRTGIGAFARRFSLDELPQLFNVLRGEMSLVGPRPERPVFIEEFKKHIPRYQLRHMMKAGLTGWAQVNGLRGNTSIERRIDYDLYYIENWSIGFDIRILARTILGGFLSKNAY